MALQRVRSNMLANNFTLDDDQGLIVGSGNNIYIDTVNNRVGINTNSPTHDFTVSGNIHATGNITASGDIQLGDSDTDTITISAEIGSDILPDITNTYDLGSASKVWAEVHATTLYGDGSQLTGIAATLDDILTNGNTSALNIDLTGGTVTATSFIGDGSQLTGLASTLNDILGNGNTTALNIVSTGDITATNFIGNGSQLTGLASTLDEVTTNGATTTNSITVGDLTVNSTNAIGLPVGTTAQRPTAANGLMRFNSTLLEFEGYNGTEWGALGGGGATYSTSAPTVNLSEGDLWFDTGTTGELYVYSGTEWLSVTGAGGTAFYQRSFVGDNTTTVFNVYGTGSATVLVYINGIFVTSPDDYSYSAGSVTFVTAPALNDEINVLVYGSTTGISLDINSLTDVSAASPSTGQVLKWTGTSWTPQADNSPTGDANRIVYDLADPTNTIVLDPGSTSGAATYKGDVLKPDGTVIVDVSSTSSTFTGGLLGNTYGDVYNPTGANKILESGTGNLDSALTVDTANATTLNATTTNISGIATFTGSSVDFTGTNTMGSWNGPVYDRTGGTLIIEDNASPNPIVHADLYGDVTGTVSSISNHNTGDLTEGSNLYYTDARVGTYISGDRTYGNITTTGYLAGPAVFTIDPAGVGDNTGKVVIAGDLQVDGTTTTINSTTLTVDDKNIVLASGSADAATANGAGITVDGANATITYDGTNDEWDFNKNIKTDVGVTIATAAPSFVLQNATGTYNHKFRLNGSNSLIIERYDGTSTLSTLKLDETGDVGFYENNGGTPQVGMHWDYADGRLGIGTSSPQDTLHVVTDSATTNDTVDVVRIEATSSGTPLVGFGPTIEFRAERGNASADGVGRLGFVADNMTSSRVDGAFIAETAIDGVFTERLRIESTGNVGINTTAPDALLHISDTSPHIDIGPQGGNRGKIGYHDLDVIIGSTSGTGEIIFKNNIGSTDSPQTSGDTKMVIHDVGMTLYSDTYNILNVATDTNDDQTSTDGIIKITNGSSYTTKAELRWDESEDLVHVSYGDHGRHISIDSSGNVGVGTGSTSPSTTLEVAGTTKAEQYLLDAIAKDISDTAVDVFVYDTRKDSDGGAWRKRTQHTSWYNETLNTATRGSRKEFPAVAVIVLENYALSIYDGDDPDLPLWKEMTMTSAANTYWFGFGAGYPFPKAVSALNGEISLVNNDTGNSSAGLTRVRFIQDDIYRNAYSISYSGKYEYNIANYSTINGSYDQNANIIVSNRGNDVAMTVLPNAPIDSATGLPVPTIAVATDSGYSIIKDNGNVVDGTCTQSNHQKVEKIGFTEDNMVFYGGFDYNVQDRSRLYRVDNILSSDTVISTSNSDPQNSAELYGFTTTIAANDRTLVVDVAEGSTNDYLSDPHLAFSDNELRFANKNGLYKVARNKVLPSAGLANKITTGYNTGWMPGDIKLATLSDTDDTDISAANTEFLTGNDSSFTSGLGSWQGYNATLSRVNNALRVADNGGYSTAYQTITTVVGKQYVFSAIVSNNGDFATISAGSIAPAGNAWGNYGYIRTQSNGTFTFTFTATATTTYLILGSEGVTSTDYDSLSLKEAEPDRSVNGKGLQVFGTVPKTPVATGAELIAYGPFTSSNYLEQPYNSDLDFGTGDFMYSMWIYRNSLPTSSYERWFGTASSSDDERIDIFSNANTDNIAFYSRDNAVVNGDVRITGIGINVWHCFHFTRQANVYKIYHNGELKGINVGSSTLANYQGASGNRRTHIGASEHWDSGRAVLDGKIALAKISGTVPSPEQIKKMYEDEKHLFQENAKATLYGASGGDRSYVRALAYDDDTELLHVGTSAGRSVFQGLRRIDNTTDAVGAAISASNGMVAED